MHATANESRRFHSNWGFQTISKIGMSNYYIPIWNLILFRISTGTCELGGSVEFIKRERERDTHVFIGEDVQ